MLKLNQLPNLLGLEGPVLLPDVVIHGVTEDSRRVIPGTLFVAVTGVRSDGHDYVEQAVAAGAVAILGNRAGVSVLTGVPYIHTENPRKALGLIAHALAGNPSLDMTVVGVTGTNGKSSSVLLTQNALNTCGYRAAAFGTLGYDILGTMIEAHHTTPFGEDLADVFKQAHNAGATHVVMEASSHAIEQDRIAGIDFDVAAFTNLTQDHLDYHQTMEAYRQAKVKLFESIEGQGKFTVVNKDDPNAGYFIKASRVPCHTYGRGGDCVAENVVLHSDATTFTVRSPWGSADIHMALVGHHNVSNALGVIAICGGLGLPLDKIAAGIAALPSVPGRFVPIGNNLGFHVVVDYAHTDDALKNVLQAARAICKGRVIVVFGCGGDRDCTKRPKMGAVATAMADYSFITSDNPRTEQPESIIAQIVPGAESTGKKQGKDFEVVVDRATAIGAAIDMAQPGDLVLIAGKGHEDYQIIGTTKIHFDDSEVARAAIEARSV